MLRVLGGHIVGGRTMRPPIIGRDELYQLIGRSAHYAEEREIACLLHYHARINSLYEARLDAERPDQHRMYGEIQAYKRKWRFLLHKLRVRSGEVK